MGQKRNADNVRVEHAGDGVLLFRHLDTSRFLVVTYGLLQLCGNCIAVGGCQDAQEAAVQGTGAQQSPERPVFRCAAEPCQRTMVNAALCLLSCWVKARAR